MKNNISLIKSYSGTGAETVGEVIEEEDVWSGSVLNTEIFSLEMDFLGTLAYKTIYICVCELDYGFTLSDND